MNSNDTLDPIADLGQAIGQALGGVRQHNNLLSRQADIIPMEVENLSVFVLGVGGIGSHVIPTLACMGVKRFEFWDADTIAEENVYPGNFDMRDVGQRKVDAMMAMLVGDLSMDADGLHPVCRRFSESSLPSEDNYSVVISCPDSLRSRRVLWETFERLGVRWDLWIDARMGGATAAVFSFLNDDEQAAMTYNGTEIEGNEIPLPCGEKATSMITSGFIPGMVAQSVRDYLMGRKPVYWQQYDGDAQSMTKINV